MKHRYGRNTSLLALAALSGLAFPGGVGTGFSAPLELLENGGFEAVEKGVPTGWAPSNAGDLTSVADPRSGNLAAQFIAREHEWGWCYFATGAPVKTGAVYRASIWAKGQGQIGFLFPQYSTTFVGSVFGPTFNSVPEWRRFETVLKIEDPRVQRIAFGIQVYGKDTTICFDDASFTFEPAENPGITIENAVVPTTTLRFLVRTREATATLLVDGKPAAVDAQGLAEVEITEGLHTLALSATAEGNAAGVNVTLPGYPETDGRWRTAGKDEPQWLDTGFKDTHWPVAELGADGYFWAKDATAKTLFCRQVILWNQDHTGPNICINPPIKEWGFAEKSLESLFLSLYSPLPYPLDDYEFVLDLPTNFRLLEKADYKTRHIMNQRPTKIMVEKTRHQGREYTRYRMAHPANEVTPQSTCVSVLPVQMTEVARPTGWGPWKHEEKTCRFFFYRRAHGNFTELQQTIPIRLLPPIDGRLPKQVMISQYCAVPWAVSRLSPEHLQAHVEQALRAGINYWVIGWNPGWGRDWMDYLTSIHDQATADGGHVILWVCNNFPLYSAAVHGHVPDEMLQWVMATPGARARYFLDNPAWGTKNPRNNVPYEMYCPSYVTQAGAEAFRRFIKAEYQRELAGLPAAEIIWNDWESPPWLSADGKACWCFCDRCKNSFREFAQLPETADLADAVILRDHRVKWEKFRATLDGAIQGEIHQVCQELGKPYMLYLQTQDSVWPACKGRLDLGFTGTPGNSTANSYYQKHLDNAMKFYRDEVGLRRVMGQRFAFFPPGIESAQSASRRFLVMSDDGFVHPQSWKSQILRIVSSFHGGVDLQCALEYCGGSQYYIGQATRIISEFEPLFWDGERADDLASSTQIAYPNLLVLRRGDERLVLLFNEATAPLAVELRNHDVRPGQAARVYGVRKQVKAPAVMRVTVPPEDVTVVHIR